MVKTNKYVNEYLRILDLYGADSYQDQEYVDRHHNHPEIVDDLAKAKKRFMSANREDE